MNRIIRPLATLASASSLASALLAVAVVVSSASQYGGHPLPNSRVLDCGPVGYVGQDPPKPFCFQPELCSLLIDCDLAINPVIPGELICECYNEG